MTQEYVEFLSGLARLSLPLMCVTLAAFAYARVGVINIALDGQIALASILYVAGCCWLGAWLGVVLALIGSVSVGIVVTLARSRFGMSDLLVGLGLLYCCYGLSRVFCVWVGGNPGYALLGEESIGEKWSYIVAVILLVLTVVCYFQLRWLRLSKVVAESTELANLDGFDPGLCMHVNGLIGSLLVSIAAVCLTEHGGSFTARVSGERGFLALAIVAITTRNPIWCCAWAVLFAAGNKVAYSVSGSSELLDSAPYLLAIVLLISHAPVKKVTTWVVGKY